MNIHHLTGAELAECFGVKQANITVWKKEGMPAKSNGYDLTTCIQWRLAREKRDQKPVKEPEAKDTLDLYREEKTKIAKIERMVMLGKLVRKKVVEEQLAARAFELKRNLLALDRIIGAKLAAKTGTDQKEIRKILDVEIRQFLEDYSRPIPVEEGA